MPCSSDTFSFESDASLAADAFRPLIKTSHQADATVTAGEAQNEHIYMRLWIHVNKVFRVSEFSPMGPTSNEADRGDTQS